MSILLRDRINRKRGQRSIRAVAREMGVSFSALSRYIRGDSPDGPSAVTTRRINAWLADAPVPVDLADAHAAAHRALIVLAEAMRSK